MKHPSIFAALLLMLLPGCTTVPTDTALATWQRVAEEAAYVGASYDLAENPSHAAHYALCQQALAAMVRDVSYTPENLRAALGNLPALTGSNGAVLDSGLTLFILGTGFLPVDSAPRVRAVVIGLQAGLDRATRRATTTPALRSLKPLPQPCQIPPR